MKIACLQFAPELGMVKENMAKADSILERTTELRNSNGRPLWLVLPEMAFSGNASPDSGLDITTNLRVRLQFSLR